MAIVWQFLLHGRIGPINDWLVALGFTRIDFLTDPTTALATLAVIGAWQLVGQTTVLFLAGLASVPADIYDAAALDGMDRGWDRLLRITFPMLAPTTLFVVVTTTITAFQAFDAVAALTKGGPAGSTETLLYRIYLEAYQYTNMGYASALSMLFMAFINPVLADPDLLRRQEDPLLMGAHPTSFRHVLRTVGANAVLIGLAAVILLPFAWMLLTVARAPADIFSDPFGLPHDAGIIVENFRRAFTAVPMARFLLNGAVVVACLLALQLAVAIPAAYALAKFRFPGSRALFALTVAALCVPIQVPMLPIYIALASLGALDSYFALIFPFILSPLRDLPAAPAVQVVPGRDHPGGAARRLQRDRDPGEADRAERAPRHRRLRGVLDHRSLERSLLAADRGLLADHGDAAARHAVLPGRRSRHRLRRPDGGRHRHRGAGHDHLPHRATPFHSRPDHDRPQMS